MAAPASPAEISVEDPIGDFRGLAAGLSRLLASFAALPAFRNAELGVVEWVSLSMLRQSERMNNKQLAKRLGVTRQRAHQIVMGFVEAGLITVNPSSQDSRSNEISLTRKGQDQLDSIDAELKILLSRTLGPKVKKIGSMRKQVAMMMRVTEGKEPVQSRDAV